MVRYVWHAQEVGEERRGEAGRLLVDAAGGHIFFVQTDASNDFSLEMLLIDEAPRPDSCPVSL